MLPGLKKGWELAPQYFCTPLPCCKRHAKAFFDINTQKKRSFYMSRRNACYHSEEIAPFTVESFQFFTIEFNSKCPRLFTCSSLPWWVGAERWVIVAPFWNFLRIVRRVSLALLMLSPKISHYLWPQHRLCLLGWWSFSGLKLRQP